MVAETHAEHPLDAETLADCLAPLRRDYAAVVLLTADRPNAARRVALRGRQEAYIAALTVCLRAAGDDVAGRLYSRAPRRRP